MKHCHFRKFCMWRTNDIIEKQLILLTDVRWSCGVLWLSSVSWSTLWKMWWDCCDVRRSCRALWLSSVSWSMLWKMWWDCSSKWRLIYNSSVMYTVILVILKFIFARYRPVESAHIVTLVFISISSVDFVYYSWTPALFKGVALTYSIDPIDCQICFHTHNLHDMVR